MARMFCLRIGANTAAYDTNECTGAELVGKSFCFVYIFKSGQSLFLEIKKKLLSSFWLPISFLSVHLVMVLMW